jgi:hypothetical protein
MFVFFNKAAYVVEAIFCQNKNYHILNAASTRGFVVEAKPQRKSRRCALPC